MIGAAAVFVLSVLVAGSCAVLLFRAHRRAPSRLLLCAGICFTGLALNDLGLIIDLFVLTEVDLVAVRALPALVGLAVLVHALVRESK